MLSLSESTVQVKAEANTGFPMWILWLVVGIAAVAAAVVLLFVLLRRRKPTPVPAAGPTAPYGTPAYAPPQDWAGQGYTPGQAPQQRNDGGPTPPPTAPPAPGA
ncbi:MAG TPA: hypothetical protein VJP90_05580 [Paenarthrobacter sp.]|nr:hypothetical protein [Paenarthrobacter sp.]